MGILISAIILFILTPVALSQETADDVCKHITGNESAKAESLDGKLECILPTYDSTQNIIIKYNDYK